MSDEKKPFAEAKWNLAADGSEWAGLHVGGICTLTDDDADVSALRDLAERINAAVDQREAKLRGAMLRGLNALDDAHRLHASGAIALRATIEGMADAIRAMSEALDGTGPAYVPAAELAAEREKTRGVWALLSDVVQEGGLAGERATELIRALGLRA